MARKDKSLVNIVASVSPEKRTVFVSLGKARGLNVQQTAVAAIDAYIDGSGAKVPEPGSPTPEERKWMRRFLDLMRSGDGSRIEGAQFMIEAHEEAERRRRKQVG